MVAMMWMKFFGFACNATIATLTRSRAGTIARSGCGASFVSAVIEECTRVVTAVASPPPADTAGLIRGLYSHPAPTSGPTLLIHIGDGRTHEGVHPIRHLAERAAPGGLSTLTPRPALCG